MREVIQKLNVIIGVKSAYEDFDYQSYLIIIIGKLLLICWFTATSSVEYLLSNEYCNHTCEVRNAWCEIHSKTSHSVDWREQQGIVFKISLIYTDKPVRKVIQNIVVWYNLNEVICYRQILIYSLDYCFFDSSLLHHQLNH